MAVSDAGGQDTLGAWLHQQLAQAYHRWDKQEAGVRRGEDPEAIHQMRVAMRRLRALMAGFAQVLDLPRATRKVGVLSRVLGQARDRDVMLARLEQDYLPQLPPAEQASLRDWLRGLRRQRQEMQRELLALLASATYQRVKEAWAKWLDHPRWHRWGDEPLLATLPHVLVGTWAELALHPGWQVTTPEADPELLHDLRKAIKRTRYQWELAQRTQDLGLATQVAALREGQEVLGQLQDGFVLATQLGDACPTLRQRLSQERAQTWAIWENLRSQLHSSTTHQQVYATLGRVLAQTPPLTPADGTVHPAAIRSG
ncbi:CHAD domain-containing protein [Gloeomargarita sp.]